MIRGLRPPVYWDELDNARPPAALALRRVDYIKASWIMRGLRPLMELSWNIGDQIKKENVAHGDLLITSQIWLILNQSDFKFDWFLLIIRYSNPSDFQLSRFQNLPDWRITQISISNKIWGSIFITSPRYSICLLLFSFLFFLLCSEFGRWLTLKFQFSKLSNIESLKLFILWNLLKKNLISVNVFISEFC